jgi:integrase
MKKWPRQDLEKFTTIKRVIDSFRSARGGDPAESTESNFFTYFSKYLVFYAAETDRKSVTPDQVIEERKQDLKHDDDDVRRKHEEIAQHFMNALRQEKVPSGKKSSSGKVALALVYVKSFYRSNYRELKEVQTPLVVNETQYKVPYSKEEWQMVLDACDELHNNRLRTWILCDKDCGMSVEDLLMLTGKERSEKFGTITEQLRNEQVPIHIRIIREKTKAKGLGFYDCFFGPESIDALNKFLPARPRKFFMVGDRQLETDFHKLTEVINSQLAVLQRRGEAVSLWENFTPKSCRKFFSGQVKFAKVPKAIGALTETEWRMGGNALAEYWMGHSIARQEGAYIVEKLRNHPEEMAKVYMEVYPVLRVLS